MKKYAYSEEDFIRNFSKCMDKKPGTAKALADKMNMEQSAISRIRKGQRKVSLEEAFEIANFLDMDILDLAFGDKAIQYAKKEISSEQIEECMRIVRKLGSDIHYADHELQKVLRQSRH